MKSKIRKRSFPMLLLAILVVFGLPMTAFGAPSGEEKGNVPAFSDAKESVDELLYGYTLASPDTQTERADVKESAQSFSTQDVNREELPEEVTIYAVDETLKEYISVPDSVATSYRLSGHKWEIVSGDGIAVDENGVITIRKEIKYYHRNPDGWVIVTSNPSGAEDETMTEEYRFGDTVLLVDGKHQMTIHGISYAQYYAEKVMDDYLQSHVTEGMSEYEIAKLCCEFVAGLDYRSDASGYTSMIVKGGGDCWASTQALIHMLDKQGIVCASRDGSADY